MTALLFAMALLPAAGIGDEVKGLQFKDIRFLTRTLDDLPKGKAYVMVFVNTTCPLARRYLPRLNRMEKEYRARGVRFVGINAGGDDTIRDMAAQAVVHEVEYPFVKDHEARCAALLGVKRTPEVVVLDAGRRLRYRGRIDDQYRIGGGLPKPTKQELRDAIEAVLAGKNPAVAQTVTDGCLITVPELPVPKTPPTFAEQVGPILHKHCVQCHRPGTAAPFSLATYEQARSKAAMIAEVVRDGRMPPWYASPAHKGFINARELTPRERDTVLQWARGGKARGDEAKLPKEPAPPADGWKIGKPDLVIHAPMHELPADGIVDYRYVVLPYFFLNTTWVTGVQILPDNPRVLHHCNMAYVRLGESFKMSNFITGQVPGSGPMTLDSGTAYRIPAGSLLVLQVHYVTTGKKEKCRLSVGFKYARGKVDRHLRFHYLATRRYTIPPGAPAHRVAASRTLATDAELLGLFSHMHLRGRDMTFKAHHPGGKSETLLTVPNYNFDWQMPYRYAPGKKRLPRGTRLEAVAHYDNSAFNPFNPNPKVAVRDGDQTFQEMMNGFVFYVDPNEKLGLRMGRGGMAR